MEMDVYFFMEEFIFPEEGGVTGTRNVNCPACDTSFDLNVDSGNTGDRFLCSSCACEFGVNWVDGTVFLLEM
ncbi:MAG: hypothetical protein GXP28_03355 [Planctomycetes bacterium]|nr:hypothetical protein [Planctomycetota bacterium]